MASNPTDKLPPTAPPVLALRPRDAAIALSLGRRKLWELTNRNLIPHVRIGRAVVYPIVELEKWLASQAQGKGGAQ